MLCNVSQCSRGCGEAKGEALNVPSLVMKLINSLTHSCMHSFASLAILALSGSAVFMIRATGAQFRMLASEIAATDEGDDDPD